MPEERQTTGAKTAMDNAEPTEYCLEAEALYALLRCARRGIVAAYAFQPVKPEDMSVDEWRAELQLGEDTYKVIMEDVTAAGGSPGAG